MTETGAGIHESLLDRLRDGVLVVERGGRIVALNPAACRILGLAPDELAGMTFAELFIAREEFDAITERVLSVVQGWGPGGPKVVSLRVGNETRTLSVATSYVRSTRGGTCRPLALSVVLSDITELTELRETGERLATVTEAQADELRVAHRKVEDRNRSLTRMRKRLKVARALAAGLTIAVFLVAGGYAWHAAGPFDGSRMPAVASSLDAGVGDGRQRMIVEPRPFGTTISLVGTLVPWRTVTIPSPIEGRIAALHVRHGQEVAEGALLAELDTSKTERAYRRAQVVYIEAQEKFATLRDWENSAEVAGARQAFTRATLALEGRESHLNKAAFLLEQGLIPASEHEDAERQHQGQLLDVEAARRSLEAARARGGAKALNKAALELSGAEEEMHALEEGLQQGTVHAPIAGVVLATPDGGGLAIGQSVERGETLMAIGDVSRMAASARADEVDAVRIETGQPVSVTGNAFPALTLRGIVTHVSSHAEEGSGGAPYFEVRVALEPPDDAHRGLLRVGMSSNLEIVVYHNDSALLVPIDAVERHGGAYRLRVVDKEGGRVRERAVEIGFTSLHSVEITAGLEPGDEIVVPAE